MPILPSRQREIRELLERLSAGRPAEQEAAAARLRLLGARALGALAAWLPGASPSARLLALRVLEGCREGRALDLLAGLCLDADPRVGVGAVEALAALPEAGLAPRLATVVRQATGPAPRAAAEALARQAAGGNVEALDAVLGLLLDEEAPVELRKLALPVVAALPARERRPLLERLGQARPGLAAEAERLLGEVRLPAPAALVDSLLGAGAGELEAATEALAGLGPAGARAVAARLALGDLAPAQTARLGRVLERTGPAGLDALRDAFERATTAGAVRPLAEALVASHLGAAVPLLHTALARLASEPDPARRSSSVESRAALHLALARLGSRAGLYDLRELLAARPPRALADLVAAAAAVGDGSVARLLLRLAAELPALAEDCREALLAIVRREKLRRTSPPFKQLSPAEAAVLDRLWPPRSRAARRPGP